MLVVVLSLPRSGSSAIGKILNDSGVEPFKWKDIITQGTSEFNKYGYWEDVGLNLINDNLIRAAYGQNSSFLHTSSINTRNSDLNISDSFFFDIDEKTLQIPTDYTDRLIDYTGHDWDVWGLTRMLKGNKWYKCYSRFAVENKNSLLASINEYQDLLLKRSLKGNIFIKDPRLIFTHNYWDFPENTKFIVIERNKTDLLKSIRNHYGQRLFTDNLFEGYSWVSNHFNYKISYQSFDDYLSIYENLIDPLRENSDYFFIKFNDIFKNDFSENLKNFLGINISSIN